MAYNIVRVRKSHVILSFVAIVAIWTVIVMVASYQNRDIVFASSSQHNLWNTKNISDYQLRVVTLALPSPPIGLDMTIHDRRVTNQSIIACDNPSDEYPENLCDPIRQYYSWVGGYTVEKLFDIADNCTRRTQISLATCPAFAQNNFQRFSNSDDMWNAAKSCEAYLQSSDYLCAVEYDIDYGYPKMIAEYTPQVMDGYGIISVKDFQIIR